MNPSIMNIHDVNFYNINRSRYVLLSDLAREVGMNSAGDVFRKYHHLSENNTLEVVQDNRLYNLRRDLTVRAGGDVVVFLRKPAYVTDRFAKAVIAAVIAERQEKARQLSEPQLIPAHRAEQAA